MLNLKRIASAAYGLGGAAMLLFIAWDNPAAYLGWPSVFMMVSAALLATLLLLFPGALQLSARLYLRSDPRIVLALALTVAPALSALIAWHVFDRTPHVQDEINYLFLAKIFASGRLYLESHPLTEFFTYMYTVNNGRWYSLFFPGWPLVLTPGVLLHVPYLVNPLLCVPVVLGMRRLALVLGLSRRFSAFVALALACVPVLLFIAGSMMSHMLGLALTLWAAVWSAEETSADRSSFSRLALIGACLGLLCITRPMNGAAGIALAGILLLFRANLARGRRVKASAVIGVFILPFLAFQLYYNKQLTGDYLTLPQKVYMDATEYQPNCYRLGIGSDVGCTRIFAPELGSGGHTFLQAIRITRLRFIAFRTDLWHSAISFLAVYVGLLGAWRGRRRAFLVFAALILPLGYFFYFYHGNCLGARHFFEGLFAWVLLFAGGLRLLGRQALSAGERPWTFRVMAARFALGFCAAPLLFGSAQGLAFGWRNYSGCFWNVGRGAQMAAEKAGVRRAVIIIPGDDMTYGLGFPFNALDLDSDVIFARDLGAQNAQLQYYYPDRPFYRYLGNCVSGMLDPLPKATGYPDLVIEGAAKFPPRARSFPGVQQVNGVRRINFLPTDISGGWLLHATPDRIGDWLEFDQHVFESGRYRLRITMATDPSFGIVRLLVDGRPALEGLDGYSVVPGRLYRETVTFLEKGRRTFRLEATGKNPAATRLHFGFDRLDLQFLGRERAPVLFSREIKKR